MASHSKKTSEMVQLIAELDSDRSWLLEKLDQGDWPEYRLELAALERDLGQLLTRASELLESE